MHEFQEKKKLRKILYSKATLIALFVIIIFIARAVLGVYYKQKISEENLLIANNKITELESREKMLNSEIEWLKTDKGVEEEIRKKFMVGKAGEQVIVIVDEDRSNKNGEVDNGERKSIWDKFIDFFR